MVDARFLYGIFQKIIRREDKNSINNIICDIMTADNY